MPKSVLSSSPPQQQPPPLQKASNADKFDKVSEIALRKKKNADAQAAFRARRANYIATLEETVTSLESVVVQLQDSCREARNEAQELRQDNTRLSNALETLRHECREREKYLRALWQARKGSDEPQLDDFPPPPPSFSVAAPAGAGTPTSTLSTPVMTPHAHPIAYSASGEQLDAQLQYTTDSSIPLPQNTYHTAPGSAYADRSPVTPFMTHDTEPVGSNGRGHNLNLAKMSQYAFNNMAGHVRDTGWHPGVGHAVTSGNESVVAAENGSTTHSPSFIPSPTVTSNEVPYGARYAGPLLDGHKSVLPGIEPVSYMMNNGNVDRSISPTVSSPHTASSTSVNSQFQFVFPTESQERTEADYHRRIGAGPELTLHGGTADVSVYSMNRRRTHTGPERPMLGSAVSYHAGGDTRLQVAGESGRVGSNGIATDLSMDGRCVRRRRSTINSATDYSSRSPSPTGHAPISSTLAVIKAQAFGALRRTRARPKKATEGAAKMAMEVLEARGIGLGINGSSKRQRLSEDDSFQP